jgi:hypothetical protein
MWALFDELVSLPFMGGNNFEITDLSVSPSQGEELIVLSMGDGILTHSFALQVPRPNKGFTSLFCGRGYGNCGIRQSYAREIRPT